MKVKLTVSEARAEAAALLLSQMLACVRPREAKRIRNAQDTGVEAVVEEIDWMLIP